MAAPVSAQEWNLDWGGYSYIGFGYVDNGGSLLAGGDFDGFDTFSTSEIHFTPSITLDNGLTFGLNVQLEAHDQNGDQIDESFMTISSDTLGTITIGSENSEGYRHMIGAPVVTNMWINSPSISSYIPFSGADIFGSHGFRTAMISSYTEVAGNNDAGRISYRTPNFNGFTVGVSYANDGGQAFGGVDKNDFGTLHDIFDIGAGYSGSFGGTDISLAARWGTGEHEGFGDSTTWGVGFNIGFGGLTIGGSYTENDNPVGPFLDSEGYSLGVSYDAAGPWSFALSGYMGEGFAGAEYNAYKLGASRQLGDGVKLDIFLVQADSSDFGGGDVEGTLIGTAIGLSF